ncbi:GIY-YIG nuclease family protein [Ensifer adhaerens]|uniref:GIY-YIG nuclease family protein n=1 Tax=Ensifer adhaerens TaxID=106592 RepID=UPI000DC1F76A|nr:GIY-YIG nuclease family protein [Ensifer adhaerens]RAS13519.1 hypothetical protein DEU52_106117 [Ensifer adhaerens]
MIYFAQPKNGGPIRIGFTADTKVRKRSLGTWLPGGVEFIHEMDGGLLGETILHLCFNPIRVERDWFKSCGNIWQFILDAKLRRPEWLSAHDGDVPKLSLADLCEEFGGIEGATAVLGYSRPEFFLQAVNWQTKIGVSLFARVEFARLLRSGDLPTYISILHNSSERFLEAAQ